MKKENSIPEIECSCCKRRFNPFQRYELPAEFESLAQALELPAETVLAMLARGEIPQRQKRDAIGRWYGPRMVFLGDACAHCAKFTATRIRQPKGAP